MDKPAGAVKGREDFDVQSRILFVEQKTARAPPADAPSAVSSSPHSHRL